MAIIRFCPYQLRFKYKNRDLFREILIGTDKTWWWPWVAETCCFDIDIKFSRIYIPYIIRVVLLTTLPHGYFYIHNGDDTPYGHKTNIAIFLSVRAYVGYILRYCVCDNSELKRTQCVQKIKAYWV